MKSAVVTVIGRPSSGKSTLVNAICGMKVSIVSPLPQTTRSKVKGIYTDSRGQLIFIDTPGYHISDKIMNKRMQEASSSALSDSDIALYVIDGTREEGKEEEEIASLLSKAKEPVVVCINKMDEASDKSIRAAESFAFSRLGRKSFVISAKEDEGIDELLIELFRIAPEGEALYDEDQYTDQSLEFRISEIIREKAMAELYEELPHSLFVEIADLEHSTDPERIWIRAFICVERDGQKGFVVGKGGSVIKRIGTAARKELKEVFPESAVRLDLQVKTAEKWRTDSAVLDKIFKS